MQIDAPKVNFYQKNAPELCAAVVEDGESYIMKRDVQTDYCVKYEAGWCGIQKEYGTDYLGDACHFYPRITRKLGAIQEIVTATLSCPEVAKLALLTPFGEAFSISSEPLSRLPVNLKDYLPEGMDMADAWRLHRYYVNAALASNVSPEKIILDLVYASQLLEQLEAPNWLNETQRYFEEPRPAVYFEPSQPADHFNVLNVLLALLGASSHPTSERLQRTLIEMISALDVSVDPVMVTLIASPQSASALEQMKHHWKIHYAPALAPFLRRWISAQLSMTTFPFAGAGETLYDRSYLLAMRYATLVLALMSACEIQGGLPEDEDLIRIAQSLSRFMDHLSDIQSSLDLYRQVGFNTPERLYSLLAF